jgi:RND family efflux transporter MFP subunit
MSSISDRISKQLGFALGCLLLLQISPLSLAKSDSSVVQLALVKAGTITAKLQLSGTVKAISSSRLAAETEGIVLTRYVEVGDSVAKGELLLALRDTHTRLAVEAAQAYKQKAEASVQLAAIDEQRLADLVTSRSTSQGSYDAARAKLAQARAELDAASAELGQLQDLLQRHQITAPFEGVITARHIEAGDWIERGGIAYELTNPGNLYLALAVPQKYFPLVAIGDPVSVAIVGQQLSSHITRIIPLAATDTRTFIVWVALDRQGLIPGMSAQATLYAAQPFNKSEDKPATSSLLVPRDALIRKADGKLTLWRVNKNPPLNVEQLTVDQEGDSAEGWISIRASGLAAGDRVVIRGNETLRPGQSVTLQP